MALNGHIRQEERAQINNLNSHLKDIEKKEQNKLKTRRRRNNKKQKSVKFYKRKIPEEISNINNWFFKKINKLASLCYD